MDLIIANLAAGLDGGTLAMLTFQLGFFAFMWKMNRDLRADMQTLREEINAKLDKMAGDEACHN